MICPYINQALFSKYKIIDLKKLYNIAKCTVKIEISIGNNSSKSSGFFLKFERNNKKFYCLMTNQHVITSNFVEAKKEILIKYENEKHSLSLKLDEEERIIICFKKLINLDVTLIEIIPKDKVDDSYFLTPSINPKLYSNIKIQAVQFPLGDTLSFSKGRISGIYCDNKYYFYHNASTQYGSSGSPIVLEKDDKVLAIHKGTTKDQRYNIGIFIGIIVEIMKEYKKNGKFKEYYENGDLKYEGNFKDDEYEDDNGQFYFENGESYIGQFKKGKKHGKGFILDKNQTLLKEDIEYENDFLIDKQKNSIDEESNDNKVDNKSENKNEDKVEKNNDLAKNIVNIFQNGEFQDYFRQCARQAVIKFKPIGDSLGVSFCDCGHEVKSHEEIEEGKYKCKECSENKFCYLKF
jgi:hypothetical protein